MSLHQAGTRVRLFPELYAGYTVPETATLSPRPGMVRPGPADHQMYVVNPVDKRDPYAPPGDMPPYRGQQYPAAEPDADGHFDHIPVGSPAFDAVHLYGCARHTLDIWEHYLGAPVTWWHVPAIPRLELVPVLAWPNAHSGPGFLETGVILNDRKQHHRFCLNFDVVAHEVGHAVLFATLGVPSPGQMGSAYLALHESFSDLFGLVGVLRFQSVITRLLAQTRGNLHALNLVNRLGRYSDSQQVRVASNATTMADVAGVALRPDGEWDDPTGQNRNQHALSEPLTGAIFDMLVEIYQGGLLARGAVPPRADTRGRRAGQVAAALPTLRGAFVRGLEKAPAAFASALLEARDVVGFGMAHAMRTLDPNSVDFPQVAARMLEAAAALGEARNLPAFVRIFLARGIDPRPHLVRQGSHLRARGSAGPRDRDPASFLAAHRLVRHGHR